MYMIYTDKINNIQSYIKHKCYGEDVGEVFQN